MLICQVILLRETPQQGAMFCRNASAARIARNDLIAVWREEGKRLPGFRYRLNELRPVYNAQKYERHPWFGEVSQNAVKGGCLDAEDAVRRYYAGQCRRPRFLAKGSRLRFRADNGVGTVWTEGRHLVLPGKMGGLVKMGEAMRWPARPIRECRLSERGGRWYASIRQEITQDEYGKGCGSGVAGIDLGLKTFATVCWPDGRLEAVESPQPMKAALTGLRRASRKVSRRQKGSSNWRKAKKRQAKRHCRVANIRKNFLHQETHRLTAEAEVVVVEDLNFKVWQKRWGRKSSDLSPGEFRRQLEYKAKWRGGRVVRAGRNYPSTQLCPDCGARTGPRDMDVRQWTCSECGAVHRRDEAAARNLQAWPGANRQRTDRPDVRHPKGVRSGSGGSARGNSYRRRATSG